jgi:hypothetical protein
VVGGAALCIHGIRDELEYDDLDLLIEPTVDNARAVVRALGAVGVRADFQPEQLARPKVQVPVKALQFWADILTPYPNDNFAAIDAAASGATLGLEPIKVAGLVYLHTMKERAISEGGSGVTKHAQDLERLQQDSGDTILN